jgi:hypothetical protein
MYACLRRGIWCSDAPPMSRMRRVTVLTNARARKGAVFFAPALVTALSLMLEIVQGLGCTGGKVSCSELYESDYRTCPTSAGCDLISSPSADESTCTVGTAGCPTTPVISVSCEGQVGCSRLGERECRASIQCDWNVGALGSWAGQNKTTRAGSTPSVGILVGAIAAAVVITLVLFCFCRQCAPCCSDGGTSSLKDGIRLPSISSLQWLSESISTGRRAASKTSERNEDPERRDDARGGVQAVLWTAASSKSGLNSSGGGANIITGQGDNTAVAISTI